MAFLTLQRRYICVLVIALLIFGCLYMAISDSHENWGDSFESQNQSRRESHSYGATTEIVNPDKINFLLYPRDDMCSNGNLKTLFIVHSHPSHVLERSVYRSTMGKDWLRKHFDFDILFVLGYHEDPKYQTIVDQEAETFEDILQADFHDLYENLTWKAVAWMKYVTGNCSEVRPIIVKTDDDVIVEMKKLQEVLLQHSHQIKSSFLCHVNNRMPVLRNKGSKWYTPKKEMNPNIKYYDRYCSGFAYVTSTEVIEAEYQYLIDHDVHYNHVDDFFVTGKLAAEANIDHINGNHFYNFGRNVEDSLASNGIFFLLHNRHLGPIIWKELLKRWTEPISHI